MTTKSIIITVISCALALLLIGGICEHSLQWGIPKCKPCPAIRDSITQALACTVLVPQDRIVLRQKIDTVTLTDTVKIKVTRTDTSTTATVQDTTMSDGARIGVTLRARLIVPPVEAAIRYTPAPDTGAVWTFYDTNTVYKTSWKGITIGTLAGFTVGVAVAGIIVYLVTKQKD